MFIGFSLGAGRCARLMIAAAGPTIIETVRRRGRGLGRDGAQALGKADGRVELVRGAGGHHVPFVDALRRWVTPGWGLEHHCPSAAPRSGTARSSGQDA